MASGFITLLTQHLNQGKFKKDPFGWLFTTTKDGLAINVYNTKDRKVLGAAISADSNSNKVHILSWAPFAEIEVENE